jgi:hypothetical protein
VVDVHCLCRWNSDRAQTEAIFEKYPRTISEKDSELRNAFLNIPNTKPTVAIINAPIKQQPTPIERKVKTASPAMVEDKPKTKYNIYSPVYYFENPALGGPALIGFMNNGIFVRIHPEDYTYFAVPKWAQNFLKDVNKVKKHVRIIFGDYCIKVE